MLFGRLHLVLLHLPIGFLLLAGLLAVWSRRQKNTNDHAALDFTVCCGAVAAVITAAFGWLLAQEGGYDELLVTRHQWLGFAAASLATATWLLRRSRWYLVVLATTIGTIVLAGHFGGSLTHGAGYLTDALLQKNEKVQETTALEGNAGIFSILQKKCVSCHNPNKKKGGLLLDTPEHVMLGGKHGPVLVPGQPDSSELLRRARLPLPHDDHMPPSGRPQLTPDEIALLERWIALGADFKMPVSALVSSGPAAGAIVFPPVPVKKADPAALDMLRQHRIAVTALGADVPWLAVSVAGKKDLDATKLGMLKKVGSQIIHLDCAYSNLDDALLAMVKNLPNLTRLNLANTLVTSEGLKNLSGLTLLDHLNITGTAVSDEAVETLAKLPALNALFVWNSRVSPAGAERIRAQMPALHLNTGTPADTSSVPLQLRPPKILFARNIFDDTVQVALDFPFRTVGLYYTIDAASPTTQSIRYQGEPLVFDQSTQLRAIAAKDGWANSPVVEASFVKSKWRPKSVTLALPPSPKYPGEGAASLHDGRVGESITDKNFLGYEGEHLTAVLDFGEPIKFQRLSVHYAENNGSWVFAPNGLQAWTSNDGKRWSPCVRAQYPAPTGMQENKAGVRSESIPQPVRARYLKVRVENLLHNPQWHSGAGQKCWVFVDEILIE